MLLNKIISLLANLYKPSLGISNVKNLLRKRLTNSWFLIAYFNKSQRDSIRLNGDPVRYGHFLLALEQIEKEKIEGSFAECGVFQGSLSKFIHENAPTREYFLFDTFEGFDERDLATFDNNDKRFQDTSEAAVLNRIGNTDNIVVRKGFFPETTVGMKETRFALAILDFDKYKPTLAALEYFYERMSTGGFIFVHDYSSPESDWACSKALNKFLEDKQEYAILMPDSWGSAVIRKV
jgi:O-methyltransferase